MSVIQALWKTKEEGQLQVQPSPKKIFHFVKTCLKKKKKVKGLKVWLMQLRAKTLRSVPHTTHKKSSLCLIKCQNLFLLSNFNFVLLC